MPEHRKFIAFVWSKLFQNRVSPALVFLYQAVVIVGFIAIPILALNWLRVPFTGAFYEHTLMVNTVGPARGGNWEVHDLGLPFGYQMAAVEGQEVRNAHQLMQVLRRYHVEDRVTITLRSPKGELEDYFIQLQAFPIADRISYLVIPYFIGLVYLLISLYMFSIRRSDPAGRAFALFTAAAAISAAALFDTYTTHWLTPIWTLSLALAGGALFNLAFIFPQEFRLIAHYPFLRWAGYIPAVVLAGLAIRTLYDFSRPAAYVMLWRAEFIYVALSAIFFLIWTAIRRFSAPSPIAREQARLILVGAIISFTPLILWFLVTVLHQEVGFSPYLLFPIALFPLATGYAILRYRLLNTDNILSQMLVYGLLSVLAIIGYAFLVSGLVLIFGGALSPTNPFVVGLMVFILALSLNPARARLQRAIDAVFFRGQTVYRQQVLTFSRDLTRAIELPVILGLLRQYVSQGVFPAQLHIFVKDPLSDQYAATPDENGCLTSDIRFTPHNALVQLLSRRRDSIFLSDSALLPEVLQPDKARLALLDSQLFIPMPGQQQLIGWLALGTRHSGEPYTSRDLSFLESLCDQAALALERVQVVADLERRVHEMNVLTRVAQGTNFTVAFDDILELIYTQTNRVIPAQDFRITLHDSTTETLAHVFYLEGNERLSALENEPLPPGQGLEWEVIRSQRPLLTDDIERECHVRGFPPPASGTYAWLSVPMNAGGTAIGVISLGSHDPAITFTEEQCGLLHAIADQAAGAIVKARLLQETEHRARQLATLNEIGRSLTSTLELKPLLSRILKSATEILNCAAGSLFLVDSQTGELVFEVVIGPVAADLTGKRLPPGTGLVGEAVETGQPILANNAKRHKDWFQKTDQQTGFDTQDMLVVPMQLKDQVIGVIEVINKLDGAPFDRNDQELLTTFTSQATIAIENARLYTLTDQALAARVEELSVMQRVDRELNASLEIDRAMRITLDWAMRQSRADSGLVGTVEDHSIRVMVSKGYSSELLPYVDPGEQCQEENKRFRLPLHLPGLEAAIDSGQPQCLSLNGGTNGQNPQAALLTGGKSCLVIPVRREAGVMGLLLLESRQAETYPGEVIAFLSRLSDHAAIAIANAQLYAEVQAANLAKSKFVSFVAHELKNPMASIKGYTELVAGGMAGPVNEMQKSFLTTVRANVDRMNTIVSDLNDLTKIQVGSLRLEFKNLLVSEMIDEVVRSLRRQLDEKDLILSIQLAENLPMVWADQLRLGQILTNLLSNAQKYTPKGGNITIGAERLLAQVNAPSELEVVHIWVQDTGIGIAPADQEKIFQQYFRTEISKEAASGTGLGLNISKSLIEMQGGRIWFDSQLAQGTTFHFTIPIAEAS